MRGATQADELLLSDIDKMQNGLKGADILKNFSLIRNDLFVKDGLLFRPERMFVPESFRNRIINLANEDHFGFLRANLILEFNWWLLVKKMPNDS